MTFWLVSIGIGFVFSILFVIALLGCLFSVGFSLAFSGVELGAGTIVLILFVVFLLLLLMVAATLFLSFLYPVAVNEGVYNFKALGRSFKLVAKRFWRVLGTNLLTMLIVFIATAAVCTGYILILASTMLDETVSLILFTVLLAVIEAFYFPYAASLSTALYFDARARFPEPPAPEYCPGFDSRNMDHYAPQTQPSGEAAAIPRENPEERKPEE